MTFRRTFLTHTSTPINYILLRLIGLKVISQFSVGREKSSKKVIELLEREAVSKVRFNRIILTQHEIYTCDDPVRCMDLFIGKSTIYIKIADDVCECLC